MPNILLYLSSIFAALYALKRLPVNEVSRKTGYLGADWFYIILLWAVIYRSGIIRNLIMLRGFEEYLVRKAFIKEKYVPFHPGRMSI